MEVRLFHDRSGQTLTIWFDEPSCEYVCEQAGEEVVLMKDGLGRVIGIEMLDFSVAESDSLHVIFETIPA